MEEAKVDQKREGSLRHLALLVNHVKDAYSRVTERLVALLRNGEITYDLLWAIFKPGAIVYGTCFGTGKPRCVVFEAGEVKEKQNGLEYYRLECHYLDFDGEIFGTAGVRLEISKFRGSRSIHSLEAFPLNLHLQKDDIRQSLIDCGRKFHQLVGKHTRHCRGRAFFVEMGQPVIVNIDSRVVIDTAFFYQMNPNYSRPKIDKVNKCKTTDDYVDIDLDLLYHE